MADKQGINWQNVFGDFGAAAAAFGGVRTSIPGPQSWLPQAEEAAEVHCP
jgi:hypothetical protein